MCPLSVHAVMIVSPGCLSMELQGQSHPAACLRAPSIHGKVNSGSEDPSLGAHLAFLATSFLALVGVLLKEDSLLHPPWKLSNRENMKISCSFSVGASLYLMCDNWHCVKTHPTICLWQEFHCLGGRFIVCTCTMVKHCVHNRSRDNRLAALGKKPVTSYL